VFPPKHRASMLQFFLELKRVALDRNIQVTHRRTAGQVSYRAAGKENRHPGFPGGLANRFKGALLRRGKAVRE